MDLLIHCALVWFNFHPNTQKPLSPALLHLVSNDADTADHTRSRFRPTFDTCEETVINVESVHTCHWYRCTGVQVYTRVTGTGRPRVSGAGIWACGQTRPRGPAWSRSPDLTTEIVYHSHVCLEVKCFIQDEFSNILFLRFRILLNLSSLACHVPAKNSWKIW